MNQVIYFKKPFFFVFLTLIFAAFAVGQPSKTAVFRRDTLLNGFKVLVWSDPTAEKVTIKLRIHSGAAFDPKDKMGVMALLAEFFFPTEQAKAFFTEDLEGSLEITSNYDYLQITATGKSTEILAMMDTIANAVVNPQINAETFKTVSANHLKKIEALRQNPVYIADVAAAKRFFGEYPYGREPYGTPESVAKIDHADLLFAKQRFLTSDNATLAIIGNVKFDYALRAARQLFGGWVKADKKVPATFTMPNPPDAAPQVIDYPTASNNLNVIGEVRYAARGVARKDNDYFAMRFLVDILQNRFRGKVPANVQVAVIHERTLLPGLISFKFSSQPAAVTGAVPNGQASAVPPAAEKLELTPLAWLKEPVTASEFEQTRNRVLAEIEGKAMADKMLDIDTFRLVSVEDEMRKLNSVTLPDVQRVAEKLAAQPFVQVRLNNTVATEP
jgi:predicted Zn-dependent peptidase